MIDLADFRRRADDLDACGGEVTADEMRCAADEIEVSRRHGQPNRFLAVFPSAVPWRERARVDATVQALAAQNATDAEAADVFAAQCSDLRERLVRLSELTAMPMRFDHRHAGEKK